MAYKICSECWIEKNLGEFQPKGRPARGGFIRNPTDRCKGCRQGESNRKAAAKAYAKKKLALKRNETPVASV